MVDSTTNPELRVAALTHVGGVRTVNEDCLFVDNWIAQASGTSLEITFDLQQRPVTLAVIDGMGGYVGGAIASTTAALGLGTQDLGDLPVAMGQISRDVLDRGHAMAGHADMGATLAGVRFQGAQVRIFNVGDSRVYRAIDGYLGQVSVDDLVPDPSGVRKGLISQSLGGPIERAVDPHELTEPIEPGTAYLLCSDGLHDCIKHDQIAAALDLEPRAACADLVRQALAAGAPDNVSVIVAKVVAP